VAVVGGEAYALALRNDAGLLRMDIDRFAANRRLTLARHRRQQADTIGVWIVDGSARTARAVDKSDAVKLNEIALRPKARPISHLGSTGAESAQEGVPELFGIGGSENRKSPERIGEVLGGHGLVGSLAIPKRGFDRAKVVCSASKRHSSKSGMVCSKVTQRA
jgi:hypothetical protein